MGLIETGKTQAISFGKPSAMVVTPWIKDKVTKEWHLGADSYDISAIIADTTGIEQADPTKETIEHEFSDSPLRTINTMGIKTFTADCTDFSHTIMKALFGCETSENGDVVAYPSQYEDLYCMIRLAFQDGQDIILPFVSMASKSVFSQMKTGVAKGTITGTCENAKMRFKTRTYDSSGQAQVGASYLVIGDGNSTEATSSMFFMNHGYVFEVYDGHTSTGEGDTADWATESGQEETPTA